MQNLAIKAYGTAQHKTAGARDIERALIGQVTEALSAIAAQAEPSPSAIADAVHWNQQVWTALSADLLHAGNRLDDDTKSKLLQLADFVRRRSLSALGDVESVQDLIDVNSAFLDHDPAVIGGSASAKAR